MSIELIRNQRDKNSGELYATPPNGKCPTVLDSKFRTQSTGLLIHLVDVESMKISASLCYGARLHNAHLEL